MTLSGRRKSTAFFIVSLVFLAGIQIGFLLGMATNTANGCSSRGEEHDPGLEQRASPLPSTEPPSNTNRQTTPPTIPTEKKSSLRFGPEMTYFAHGASRINKEDFLDRFDYGYRRDPPSTHDVLVLYNHKMALPQKSKEAVMYETGNGLPQLSAEDAFENCNTLYVLPIWGRDKNQCLAVVGQYESHTIQRWNREKHNAKSNATRPFRAVQTGEAHSSPGSGYIARGQAFLKSYLEELDDSLKSLLPLVDKVAKNKTVMVMLSNLGQADLLVNFVCAAKSRNLDISSLVVFATDEGARDVATELGLTVYYNEKMFKDFPTGAAKEFGDGTFAAMMRGKMLCVHLVNALGYHVLFQDVDIVWYKNPLDVFATNYTDFDMMFQDEASTSRKQAPHSANTGFYFVRHNQKTRYFLQQMIYAADFVLLQRSHQEVMNVYLANHAAVFGLRVKSLPADDFPSGAHYHYSGNNIMRNTVEGKHTPYLMHMSWTTNKSNKLLYFQQMGLWYVQKQCEGEGALKIAQDKNASSYLQSCCSAEPLVTCHFKDKPSIIPCLDSPTIDKNGKSFWKEKQ